MCGTIPTAKRARSHKPKEANRSDLQGVPLLPPKPDAQCHEDDPETCVKKSRKVASAT